MKYRNFLLIIVLIFTSLPLAAQNYIGMRNHELLDASKMRIENNKLYVISEQSGISLIDLNSNELVSVMEDTDTSSYKNLNFMYFNDLLYTEDMNVFDGNTLELTNKLPFEGTLLGVSDDSYYVRHSPYNVHIINKQNYDSVKVLKLNINLGEFRVAYKNGYILTHGFSNNLTIYNDVEKVGLIPNSPSIYYLSVVDNYVVADMVHKKIVYDFDGNIVYESSINTKSNIYINDDLDYIYIDRINEDENEIVTGNLLSDEEKRVSYVNPIWNNFYYYILGFYDDNYIVYDRVESYLYKFNTDLQQKEYISKFNTFPTNLELKILKNIIMVLLAAMAI